MLKQRTDNFGMKKIIFAVLVQGLILGLSVISGFILPEKMGPTQFGYWQRYLFYLTYINLFGFGFNDGIALFYGGYDYNKLPFERLRSALRVTAIYSVVLCAVLIICVNVLTGSEIYRNIFTLLALNIPITIIQCVILTAFLSVGKTEIYNVLTLLLKFVSVVFYLALIFMDIKDYLSMMWVDFIARAIITLVCVFIGRKLLFGKADTLKNGFSEIIEKSKAGFPVTIALIVSMFMPVMSKWIIELYEPGDVYGVYSFGMSLLSIILSFANVIGMVVFPFLKRMESEKMKESYSAISWSCDAIISLALFVYIPLMFLIQNVMEKYIPALEYLPWLLAMCLPLSKIQLLITPYYKAGRLEKEFFSVNLIGVIVMGIGLFSVYFATHSLKWLAFACALLLYLWEVCSEVFLKRKMGLSNDIFSYVLQIVMMAIFAWAGSFLSIGKFAIIYSIGVLIFIIASKFSGKTDIILEVLKKNK